MFDAVGALTSLLTFLAITTDVAGAMKRNRSSVDGVHVGSSETSIGREDSQPSEPKM